MSNAEQTRRNFLTNAAVIAALGASTSKLFGDTTPTTISEDALKHAEHLAGIKFTSSEREQMSRTLQEQQSIFSSRIAQGEIPNTSTPATVFNPRVPGKPLQLCTSNGTLTGNLPEAGPCPRENQELAFAPVWKLCQWLKKREITSEQLTRLALDRLKQFDKTLACVISYTENTALKQAKQADRELDAGNWRGPLHEHFVLSNGLFDQ